MALTVLCVSLVVAITTKIVEKQSEAFKAREASEKALVAATNIERLLTTTISTTFRADLSAYFSSPFLSQYRNRFERKLGDTMNDRGFSKEEFENFIRTDDWRNSTFHFWNIDLVIIVVPKGKSLPECFSIEDTSNFLSFSFAFSPDDIEVPQMEDRFATKCEYKVTSWNNIGSKQISLVDFQDATFVSYIFIPTKQSLVLENTNSLSLADKNTQFEKSFPASNWQVDRLRFEFDVGRQIEVWNLKKEIEPCTGRPYFVGKIKN